MLKLQTHFEQVPLEAIRAIVEAQSQTEPAREPEQAKAEARRRGEERAPVCAVAATRPGSAAGDDHRGGGGNQKSGRRRGAAPPHAERPADGDHGCRNDGQEENGEAIPLPPPGQTEKSKQQNRGEEKHPELTVQDQRRAAPRDSADGDVR